MSVCWNDLCNRYGPTIADEAMGLVSAFGFVWPEKGEYLSGKESIHLPLHPYGVTIRIGDRVRDIVSDGLLVPLLEIPLSYEVSLEFLPGIRVGGFGGVEKYKMCLRAVLEGLHLPHKECIRNNLGKIVYDSATGRKVHAVVLDRGALKRQTGFFSVFFNAKSEGTPIQDAVFSEFKALAFASYDVERGTVQQECFRDFLSACRKNASLEDEHPDKVLYAEWRPENRSERGKASRMRRVAEAYQSRISTTMS